MAAQSEPSNFQYDMCMCADNDKLNQTTAALSKLHGHCCKALIYATFNWLFFKVNLLSGSNYNTGVQKRAISSVGHWAESASFDSNRDKCSLYHSITQPQIPGQIIKMVLIQQNSTLKEFSFCPTGDGTHVCYFSTQMIFLWNIFCDFFFFWLINNMNVCLCTEHHIKKCVIVTSIISEPAKYTLMILN